MANLPQENAYNISLPVLQQRLVELDIQIANAHQEISALRAAFPPLNNQRPPQQLLDVEIRYQELCLEREDVRDEIDSLMLPEQQQVIVPQQQQVPPEIEPQQLGNQGQPPLENVPHQMEIQHHSPPEIDPQQLGIQQEPPHVQQPQRRSMRQRQRRATHRQENIGETSDAGRAHKRTRQS